jgi:serine/threonine protein kinase
MTLSPGTKLGPYEIIAPIGAGGMGEVYRAKDTRLDRTVAIKVLPSHLSADPERKQRFEREARTISSLNHPHICTLHDIGHQDGIDYLVMEYVEGESLAQRLEKGALPTEQVLRYGIQIAEALDKAHRQGIIHRDLKPGNIMLTKSGAKLLDFGLAKYQETKAPVPGQSQMETRHDPLTEEGVVLGTVQYMAPEQLEGKEIDGRTDIFALGTVLYEMATGRKAFIGTSQASLISAILKDEPTPISQIQPMTPPALDAVAKNCLAKDPDERWQTAHDVTLQLKWIADSGLQSKSVPLKVSTTRSHKRLLMAIISASLLVNLLLGLFAYRSHQSAEQGPLLRLSALLPGKTAPNGDLALSPDGRRVAFVLAGPNGQNFIWIRPLALQEAQLIGGTEDASYPFWSPDSRFIAFFSKGKLKKIDTMGGAPQTLADAPDGRGGTWNRNGDILFAPGAVGGLVKVSSSGGQTEAVTSTDAARPADTHRFPCFLPDGVHFLFVLLSADKDAAGIYRGSLQSKETTRVLADQSSVAYAPPGYLFFVRGGNLTIQRFDADHLQLEGEASPLSDVTLPLNVINLAYEPFSVAENCLIYLTRGHNTTQLLWFSRDGKQIGTLGSPGFYEEPQFSPNERKIAVTLFESAKGTSSLWIIDIASGAFNRFTFDPLDSNMALWSPDSNWIVFKAYQGISLNLYQKAANGTGREQLLLGSSASSNWKYPNDWSPDGKYILYGEINSTTKRQDLLMVSVAGESKPTSYLQTEFNEAHARFSPDGKWVAYTSDESGRPEVYVRSFPDASGGRWQISSGGGDQPIWRRDGKELFYLASDMKLMAVKVNADAAMFEAGSPLPLFETHAPPSPFITAYSIRNQYFPTADGQKFLVNTLVADQAPSTITVLSNWEALLKK